MRALALGLLLLPAAAPASETSPGYEDLHVRIVEGPGIHAMRGVALQPLRGSAFYEAVERPDLAARYRRNLALKWGLALGGAAVTTTGVVLRVAGHTEGCGATPVFVGRSATAGGCLESNRTNANVSYALIGAGMLGAVVGLALDPHPVDAEGARHLADAYNRRLRERTLEKPAFAGLRAGVAPVSGGAGLALAGTF